ncbi:aspartate--tRNA ligase [Candidatus Saccharibacteria bacterium]|nr:aspartate--tRNA ligase [Candidatus Saccharibacteria bacterium]MBR3378184.1 aspartate--tRNA ligase [Candidatus Saccharibacteria bacterium]
MRALAKDLTVKSGKVELAGWVNSRRDHGGLIFIDLRDHTGVIQLVIDPQTKDAFELAEHLRDEYVVHAVGTVRQRGEGLENPNIPTGNIEVVVETLDLLNRSDALPVSTHDEGVETGEELRLKYRYLDLRRPSMQARLARRSEFYRFMRDYMHKHEFIEVTTPILANSSPEGARDFIIPSRLRPGQFYALPQAPQQFKQLLMVGGVPRYYQIAACFRDEDPRADRLYGEFYQLDCEMSFVDDGETVRQEMEPLLKSLVTDYAGKKLMSEDIPRIPYQEAMEKYGTDKPDLRYGMELIDLTEDLKDTQFAVFAKAECVKAICVKNGADLSRSQIDGFTEEARKLGAGGLAYLTYTPEGIKSPIAKFLSEAELEAITKKTGAEAGDAVFFGADKRDKVNKVLGALRISFADHFKLKDPNIVAYCWIVDFPFYEWDDGAEKLDFGHNPFSMPKGGLEALEAAKTDEEKLAIVADQFDMVMNGYEICSGAVRNHNPEIMYKAFGVLGYDEKYVEQRFGGMLNALKFGAPPHAGCAYGIDRVFMVLEGTDNIRDIVAFPKNGSGADLMMGAPSVVDEYQITDCHLQLIPDDEE